jgi:hypothetical protein
MFRKNSLTISIFYFPYFLKGAKEETKTIWVSELMYIDQNIANRIQLLG